MKNLAKLICYSLKLNTNLFRFTKKNSEIKPHLKMYKKYIYKKRYAHPVIVYRVTTINK